MEISFANRKLEKIFSDHKSLLREYGTIRAKLIKKRLAEFMAAETLSMLSTLPQVRCHELIGNRKGTLAVDLDHPYRLIFKPTDDPLPVKNDGGLDWNSVKSIKILEVVNYHE
ncbi:MAG: type II toxin-antitoxin system RelE/ParE family toxin [Bacteroidota bacterium]